MWAYNLGMMSEYKYDKLDIFFSLDYLFINYWSMPIQNRETIEGPSSIIPILYATYHRGNGSQNRYREGRHPK